MDCGGKVEPTSSLSLCGAQTEYHRRDTGRAEKPRRSYTSRRRRHSCSRQQSAQQCCQPLCCSQCISVRFKFVLRNLPPSRCCCGRWVLLEKLATRKWTSRVSASTWRPKNDRQV